MFRFDLLVNKLIALALVAMGWVCVRLEGDATFLVLALIISVPMLFAKRSWVK